MSWQEIGTYGGLAAVCVIALIMQVLAAQTILGALRGRRRKRRRG